MFNTSDIKVVFAGAGCGKTTYLIGKVKEELASVLSEEIAFVSFTRKGASEGLDRLIRETRISRERLPYFKTLNALTFAALGYSTKNVFNKKWAKRFNDMLGFNLSLNKDDECNTQDDKYLSIYDMDRHGFIPYTDAVETTGSDGYKRFVSAYTEFKKAFNLFDYNDCLVNFVSEGNSIPVSVAFIDEAQDLTYLQWKVCEVAFQEATKIYIAGDDYQSIYTYAGARPHVLIDLAKNHETVKLERSYRLPKPVYTLARGVTDMIQSKMDKDYVSLKSSDIGSVTFLPDERTILDKIANGTEGSWLCLFRNNYFTAPFCKTLRSMCVPFHSDKGFCVSEQAISKIRKFQNFRKLGYRSQESEEQFKKEYGIRSFDDDISETNLFQGEDKYFIQGYTDVFSVDKLADLAKAPPNVFVSTIHKIKGGEADNVVVFLDCTRKVFRNKFLDLDSELRLLYVAFTRARKNLYIVRSRSTYGLDDIVNNIYDYARSTYDD